MYDIKYNIINIIHPKVKHKKTIGHFDYLGWFITSVLLRRYTFNEFLNLVNATLTSIFILSAFHSIRLLEHQQRRKFEIHVKCEAYLLF